MSYITRFLALTSIVFLSGCCFSSGGPTAEERAKTLNKEIKSLKAVRDAVNREEKALKQLLTETKERPYLVTHIQFDDLQKAVNQALPLSFPAKRLDKRVKGTVRIKRIEDMEIKGDRIRLKVSGRGEKLKVTKKIPSVYKKVVKNFIRGLEAGMTMTLEGKLHVTKKNRLRFQGVATDVTLKKNNDDLYRTTIRDALNQRILDEPHFLNFPPVKHQKQKMHLKSFLRNNNGISLLYF